MLEMRKYRAKKKEREQQQLLPDEERRQMAVKKREAAKKKAQQAWRLKVKISNSRPEQSTPCLPKKVLSHQVLQRRAKKQAKDALPNTTRRKKSY